MVIDNNVIMCGLCVILIVMIITCVCKLKPRKEKFQNEAGEENKAENKELNECIEDAKQTIDNSEKKSMSCESDKIKKKCEDLNKQLSDLNKKLNVLPEKNLEKKKKRN